MPEAGGEEVLEIFFMIDDKSDVQLDTKIEQELSRTDAAFSINEERGWN